MTKLERTDLIEDKLNGRITELEKLVAEFDTEKEKWAVASMEWCVKVEDLETINVKLNAELAAANRLIAILRGECGR